jgi:hypothetical protein
LVDTININLTTFIYENCVIIKHKGTERSLFSYSCCFGGSTQPGGGVISPLGGILAVDGASYELNGDIGSIGIPGLGIGGISPGFLGAIGIASGLGGIGGGGTEGTFGG